MDGRRLAFLESSLVDLRGNQVWVRNLDPFKNSFLHNLRDMGSYHYGSNFIKSARALGEGLLQRYQPPHSKVLRNVRAVESLGDLIHDFHSQFLVPVN